MDQSDIIGKEVLENSYGKVIDSIKLVKGENWSKDYISISLDGKHIAIKDKGQQCCESRYMLIEESEDLNYFQGAKFLGVDLGSALNATEPDWKYHETQFLNITTSSGVLSVSSHNKHNGYYSGFLITVEELQ